MIVYVTAEEVLLIHSRIIDLTGGTHGVRDIGRIASAVMRPKQQISGKDLYPSLFDKTAVYFEVLAYHHPFTDGNKRTAIAVAERFISLNQHTLLITNRGMVNFVLDAVAKKYDILTLAQWFKKHAKRIR